MTKIEEMLAELCPNGVEWKELGEVCEFTRGNGLQKKDFVDEGLPCIHYGQIYTYYGRYVTQTKSFVTSDVATKLKKASYGDLIVATTSENVEDVGKAVVWLGRGDVYIGGHSCVIKTKLNTKYLSHIFQTLDFQKQKEKLVVGTKVIELYPKNLAKIKIPIPPLEIQEEIVQILDKFTEYVTELTAELTKRQKQYEYFRDYLLNFDRDSSGGANNKVYQVEWKTLGEIGKVSMCKRILKNQTSEVGDVPFYKIGTFGKRATAYISRELFEDYKEKYSYPKVGDILISASGTIGRTVVFNGEDSYFQDSNIVWLEHDESQILNRYLFYFYQMNPWQVSSGGTISRLYNGNIEKTKIPVPSFAIQQRIVHVLDNFDTVCNDLKIGLPKEIELRQKQYEYFRDKLLTFAAEGVYTDSTVQYSTVQTRPD